MIDTPDIDYGALSPVIALVAGICVVLLAGLIGPRGKRWISSGLTVLTLAATAGLMIWRLGEADVDLVAGALRMDGLSITIGLIVVLAAAFVVPMQLRDPAAEQAGYGESHTLLLGSVLGMVLLAQATNLISFFVALELLSIPLYVLCGSHRSRTESLESGLKYLIVGSIGSATLLYGLAFVYGGSGGATDFTAIAQGIGSDLADDPLILIGIAFVAVGLAFKVSIAPFHQWTPDVYEGAPTPITAFMAVATKAAAFAVFARFFITALGPSADQWQPALAALAAVTIVVGNVGALAQRSLKRLLGYSGVAQAGYMLVGLLVGSIAGTDALVFYLAAYTVINIAAFAVIAIRERETPLRRRHRLDPGNRQGPARAGLAADDLDAGPRRPAGHRRLHGQALPDRIRRRRRLHLARCDDRDRLDDLPRLLPAGDRGDLDAPGAPPLPRDRRRLAGGRRGSGPNRFPTAPA